MKKKGQTRGRLNVERNEITMVCNVGKVQFVQIGRIQRKRIRE